MNGLGCRQIANPFSDCGTAIPRSVLAIKEHDKWQARGSALRRTSSLHQG